MTYDITVNGVTLPAPAVEGGLTESYESIWSSDTGRTASGKMVGTLVATKAKLKFTWNALTWTEASTILGAILNKGFVTCTYPSIDGTVHSVTGYFGTPSFGQYSWADGLRWATEISVDFVEQ